MESQLRFAQQTYSEAHPVVRRLRARLQQLRGEGALLANPESLPEGARKAAYGDLLRKLNYLNIALEMENAETPYYFAVVKSPELPTAPIWPRRPLIMVWSFFLSLLAAVALTFGRELFARSASPERGRAAEAAGPAWPAAFFHRAPAPAPLGEESESSDHGLFRN